MDRVFDFVLAVLPVGLIIAAFLIYDRHEKRKRHPVERDTLDEVLDSLEKIWPHLYTDQKIILLTKQPKAFYGLARAVAHRRITKRKGTTE